MEHSYAEIRDVTCSFCGATFSTSIWLIVDIAERHDLVARISEGTLHRFECPVCGSHGEVAAPLLLYRPGEQAPLVFLAANQMTDEEYQEQFTVLSARLRASLGDEWREEWLDDLEEERRQIESAALLGEEIAAETGAADDLPAILLAFLNAESWDDARELVAMHPELLSLEVDALLEDLAEDQDSEEARRLVEEDRQLLRRCRQVGVEKAFAEYAGEADPTILTEGKSSQDLPTHLPDLIAQLNPEASLNDRPRQVAICRRALELVDRDANPELWAGLQVELASNLGQNQLSNWADNLEQALDHYQQALEVYTPEHFPSEWILTHSLLSSVYQLRFVGQRAENLEQAIASLQQALEARPHESSLEEWARAQHHLGSVYVQRIHGKRDENLEHAIEHLQVALGFYTREAFPSEWADIQNELGDVYLQRSVYVEQAKNLDLSIAHSQRALEVYTREGFPTDWAETQYRLGAAYGDRSQGSRVENLGQAIAHLQQALEVYTREDFPNDWAKVQVVLGLAYEDYTRGDRSENVERAIAYFQQALEVYTREDFPGWVTAQRYLGQVYIRRTRGDHIENLEQAIQHLLQALEVYTREDFPGDWAKVQLVLGVAYMDDTRGSWSENVERAIAYFQQALEVYTREDFPVEWAMAQNSLASAYLIRIHGQRAENIEQAIAHLRLAIEVRTREAFPVEWAQTQNNLGEALRERIRGERADNLEQAIEHYQLALEVYRREALLFEWTQTQNNMGNAYFVRIRGERADNLEQDIQLQQRALEILPRETLPHRWAKIHNDLANAYSKRIRGERADNFEQAIVDYQLALEVFTREAFPVDWARTQNNLGFAYIDRIRGERADNLEQAIAHSQQALELFTREMFPEQWAQTQDCLGQAYLERIRGERADNLEQAIAHFQLALEVYTREAFPERWAWMQDLLGQTYWNYISGDKADNLEQAITHFQLSLEELTREAFPDRWAQTQNNLGLAYTDRIRGERADNLEQAIAHYQLTLEVCTREAFPERWAQTQNNLGNVYLVRIYGEQADNLEQAIAYYQLALEVRSREAFPERWAMTQMNVGNAYINRIHGERADNLEQAIAHFQLALEVYTREAFPERWAQTQVNLGFAYSDRVRGERAANLEQAIAHYRLASQVLTHDSFPNSHRLTLSNLGNLYFGERRWEEAQTAYEEAIASDTTLLAAAYTETGRKSEVGKTARLYVHSAYCLLQLGQPAAALCRLEQGKTRLLAEALALGDADLAALPVAAQQAMLQARIAVRTLEAEMRQLLKESPHSEAELGQQLRRARTDLNRLIDTIRVEHPDFMPSGLDLPDILSLVPVGGALVAPLITSHGSAIFVLPHGLTTVTAMDIVVLDQFDSDILNALLIGTRDEPGWLRMNFAFHESNSQEGWMTAISSFTSRLWDVLMRPAHERLSSLGLTVSSPVILLPQGGLGLLPLHAAWREVNGTKRAFLDDYTVLYGPSAYALKISSRRLDEQQRRKGSLLAVANPTADLPYTQIEIEAIAGFFQDVDRHMLIGNNAAQEAVLTRAPGCTYLHFACHGFYDWQVALNSGLVLAGGHPFTLAEIISPQFDLSAARLITLSACETGLTEFSLSPDEYIGLPTGFLQAGASTVVSTLWGVNDFSTALLMQAFYRRHLAEGQGIAEALRGAQLWLQQATVRELGLAEYWEQIYLASGKTDAGAFRVWRYYQAKPDDIPFAHPYYWAAFTYNGV